MLGLRRELLKLNFHTKNINIYYTILPKHRNEPSDNVEAHDISAPEKYVRLASRGKIAESFGTAEIADLYRLLRYNN